MTRDKQRLQMIRRTGKPHVYFEDGEWRVLERTAPGEWWITPFERWSWWS